MSSEREGREYIMAKKKAVKEVMEVNSHIVDLISPMEINFDKTFFMLGDVFCKVLVISNYKTNVEIGWESKICNIEGVVYKSAHTRIDPSALIEYINNNIKMHRGRMIATKEALVQERSKKAIADYEKLLRAIDQEQEAVFNKSIVIMVMANSKEELIKKSSRVVSKISVMGMKAKPLSLKQKLGFESISPLNFISSELRQKIERNMQVSTIAGGFPFASSGLNDNTGNLLGEDTNRGAVVIDIWKREGDRTNSNITALGNPGVGKSSAIKKIMYNEWLQGTKIIVCDPQGEYKEMCFNLGGDWINLTGGKGGRINPLEVRNIPEDDEDDEIDRLYKNSGGIGALSLHFQTLRTFFKLYIPNLTDMKMACLEQVLEIAYNEKGINYETEIKPDMKYPIMEDVYNICLRLSVEFEKTKSETEVNEYKELSMLLRSISIGADKYIWNGETNINMNSDFICLDTKELQKADEKILRTQYYNIMTWAWNKVTENREEKILLIFDEAYLVVDPNTPEALMYMRNFSKQIRKFEGGLIVISHSCVDFLDDSVKRHGQALMDNPTYKLLMGTDGKNLQELANLYELTEAEQEILNAKRRGHVLLSVGSKRVHTIIKLEPHETKVFGKGGGR
jgi:hypothetical protein